MKANESGIDRTLRFVLGIILIVASFRWYSLTEGGITGIILAVIGAVLLITGLVGFCPAYRLVGVNTCRIKS